MSALEALKEKLKQDNSPSETWYNRQKVEQFEHCLYAVEARYTEAHALLSSLMERLSSHLQPF